MRLLTKALLCTLGCLTLSIAASYAQKGDFIKSLGEQNHWVDSVYNKLSRKHRIAQLLFVRAHTNKGQAYEDSVAKVIKKQRLGGVVFFQGGPVRQVALTNRYQKLAKVPLIVTMDGEWGLGMRLDSTISFPYQLTLGAIQDNQLIYKMGREIGWDFKRMGMQMNLAPDMDVNNNPDNPVIGFRSFGDNKYNVAQKGIQYMKGMQDVGILTTAKHFPGHGDTNVDSHLDLPLLPFSKARLDSLEEYPFHQAIKAGLSGVMIAHMNIPALDTAKNVPSTLSRPVITGELKDSLGFKGLVVSDAMEMKGVVKYFPDGEADVRAFIAGNDIIELSEDSKRAIKKIRKAVRKEKISKEEFEAKVKKVLAAKYWAGLNQYHETDTARLYAELNRAESKELVQQLSDAAVTLLKGNVSSLQFDPNGKTAIISIGATQPTTYQQELAKIYTNNRLFNIAKNDSVARIKSILDSLKQFDQVLVGIHDSRLRPGSKLDFSVNVKALVAEIAANPKAAICVFANPYVIAGLPGIDQSQFLLECYQKSDEMQRAAVKVINGQLKPTGKLPVSVNTFFPFGTGLTVL